MCPAKRSKRASTPKLSASISKSLRKYQSKRDFEKTNEPSGAKSRARAEGALAFVIQKHAASHLHFDLRLEVDGVMKSWAVPKGPSVDTSVKRLAMEVEDHPMEYNKFEGTIPQGEYGGGTVMLWDRGTYTPDEVQAGESLNDAARRGLAAGKLAFTFHGERLKGSHALVRTKRGEDHPQWLFLKHDDKFAKDGKDVVADVTTSVATKRTMEEIAASENKELATLEGADAIEPMQPTSSKRAPLNGEYAIEGVPDGQRVLVFIANGTVKLAETPHHAKAAHTITSLDDAPAVFAALMRLARGRKSALILDGYLTEKQLVAIDLLLEDDQLLVNEPFIERRMRLEAALTLNKSPSTRSHNSGALQVVQWQLEQGDEVRHAAKLLGTRAVVAKRIDSPYESGTSKLWLTVSP